VAALEEVVVPRVVVMIVVLTRTLVVAGADVGAALVTTREVVTGFEPPPDPQVATGPPGAVYVAALKPL